MKKIFSILSIFFISLSALMLTGCGCDHYWEKISNTATCESDGVITYKCSNCGETKTETSYAIGHNWNKEGSTATCTSSGVATYKCNNCNKTKTESEQALGHSYYSWGECMHCGKFKYDISLSISLPKTLSYICVSTSHVYSRCQISKINFELQDGYLCAFFYGSKTYDEDGSYGNTAVNFTCVLKDSSGAIITSTNIYISGLIPNQQFGSNGYYGTKLCSSYNLSLDKSYILEVVDRRIY